MAPVFGERLEPRQMLSGALINVLGNGVAIHDGDSTVSVGNWTLFEGREGLASPTASYSVVNGGDEALTLAGLSVPAGFSVVEGLSGSLAPGESDTFTIALSTEHLGAFSGDITFTTNVMDLGKFNFKVEGHVLEREAGIKVGGDNGVIESGNGVPQSFSAVYRTLTPISQTFKVTNTGDADLATGSLSLPMGFVLTEGLDSTIAPGKFDTFTVTLSSDVAGKFGGDVSFTTNAPGLSTFEFGVEGVVIAVGAEIFVSGKEGLINDGSVSPSNTNATLFALVKEGTTFPTATYKVTNTGSKTLDLGSVSLPAGFVLAEGLDSSIGVGESDTFTVALSTDVVGHFMGDVSFTTSTSDIAVFNFKIDGRVQERVPNIDVSIGGEGVQSTDVPGETEPQDFGSVYEGAPSPQKTYTVTNTGDADLVISKLTVPAGFEVVEGLDTTIAPGKSDTFTVALLADGVVAKTYSGTLKISTNIMFQTMEQDEPQPRVFRFDLIGEVLASEAGISVNGGDVTDDSTIPISSNQTLFETVKQGAIAPTATFKVTNTGKSDLTLASLVVPDGFTIVDGLASVLAPGASDKFTIALTTGVAGVFAGDVSFETNVFGRELFNFRVQGEVAALEAGIGVSSEGEVIADGKSAPQPFNAVHLAPMPAEHTYTVYNTGDLNLETGSLMLPTGYVVIEGLASTIAPGDFDTFTIGLSTDTVGTFSGEVSFTTNVPGVSLFNFKVEGRVADLEAEIGVSSDGEPIGNGTGEPQYFLPVYRTLTPSTRTFKVTNTGDADLLTDSLSLPAGFVLTEGLDSVIEPGKFDTFTVALSTEVAGKYSGEISFTTNVPGTSTFEIGVEGVVIAVPAKVFVYGKEAIISDGSINPSVNNATFFPMVKQGMTGPTATYTVTNTGDLDLETGSLTVPAGFIVVEGLDGTIEAGKSDTFTIALSTDVVGHFTGDVSFTTNAEGVSLFNFKIDGHVQERVPNIDVSIGGESVPSTDLPGETEPQDFGWVYKGGTSPQKTYTVTNTGDADLAISGVVVPTGFVILEGLDGTIAPGKSDTFTVALTTDNVGMYSGELKISTNIMFQTMGQDEPEPRVFRFGLQGEVRASESIEPAMSVTGHGILIANGDVTPSKDNGTDFGPVIQGWTKVSQTFTVTNAGDSELEVFNIELPAGFWLAEGLEMVIAPGKSDSFTIVVNDNVAGVFAGNVSLATNVEGGGLFEFAVSCTVVATETKTFNSKSSLSERTFIDENSNKVVFALNGPGNAAVIQETKSGRIVLLSLGLVEATKSSLVINVTKGKDSTTDQTGVNEITVYGGLVSLSGVKVNVEGDFLSTGVIKSLTLNDVGTSDQHSISIGGASTDKVSLVLGRLSEVSIKTSATITSLRAVEWQDNNATADELNAFALGSLVLTGKAESKSAPAIAGDFEADIALSQLSYAVGAPMTNITVSGHAMGDWLLGVHKLNAVNVKGNATGTWSAGSGFNVINIGRDALGLTVNSARDIANFTVQGWAKATWLIADGSVGLVSVAEFLDGGITADKANQIVTRGRAATKTTGTVAGDFTGDVNLSGQGVAVNGNTLGTVSIAGALRGNSWTIMGKSGGIVVGSALDSMLNVKGDLAAFTSRGQVQNTTLHGEKSIGSISVLNWLGGAITADKITSIVTRLQAAAGAIPAIPGDFTGALEISGEGVATSALSLGAVNIQGEVRDSVWHVTGKTGNLLLGAIKESSLNVSGNIAGVVSRGRIHDSVIESGGVVGSISAVSWSGGGIVADKVGSIITRGQAGNKIVAAIAGDFSGSVTITGEGVNTKQYALGSASITGTLLNAAWRIDGNSGVITVGAADSSSVFVGVSTEVASTGLPTTKAGFSNASAILAGFTVTGRAVSLVNVTPSFINTRVSAGVLSSVTLKRVDLDEPLENGFVAATRIGNYVRQSGALASNVVRVTNKTAPGVYDPTSGPVTGYRLEIVG